MLMKHGEEIENLRIKKPILPITQFSPTPTANQFQQLQETSDDEKGKTSWNFNPLFAPSADDAPLDDAPAQLPAKAFRNWWVTPPATMQEAEALIEASSKIKHARKDFFADKSLHTPDGVCHAAEACAEEEEPGQTPPGKKGQHHG